MLENKKSRDLADEFNARFDIYGSMAHYLAKKLHQRPSSILDEWSTPELIVAYGQYANEDAQKNYNEWKNLPSKERVKYPPPQEYAVRFYGDTE